jgi:hypothetical protein
MALKQKKKGMCRFSEVNRGKQGRAGISPLHCNLNKKTILANDIYYRFYITVNFL